MAESSFNDKIVVIAGNGQELGLVLARSFVVAGSRAVIVAAPAGERNAEMFSALQNEALPVVYEELDICDPLQSAALVVRLVERYGRVDILVNSSTITAMSPAETFPANVWEESISRILSAAFYCAQAAGRQMLSQGRGVIVNLTSVLGVKAVEGYVASTVVHAGLQGMTNALGVEWAGRGVRVIAVALPLEMGDASRRTPLRHAVTPGQIANTLLYLTSDDAAYVTAETIRVDGGWSAYQLF
jgi:NAD(P)-dependent dehydrogenase (short-subunit alcohol dehydrogenase family)